MERSDDRLSTRDIASPTSTDDDPRFERDAGGSDAAAVTPVDATHADPAPVDTDPAPVAAEPTTVDAEAVPVDAEPIDTAPAPDATAERDTSRDTGTSGTTHDDAAPLLADGDGFQSRWEEIQVRFVDEPRGAVEDADALVATVMQRLAEGFAQERERLEAQWGRGEDISTEDLRVALQRYRSFFQRLLST
jgi:hypothetical protein